MAYFAVRSHRRGSSRIKRGSHESADINDSVWMRNAFGGILSITLVSLVHRSKTLSAIWMISLFFFFSSRQEIFNSFLLLLLLLLLIFLRRVSRELGFSIKATRKFNNWTRSYMNNWWGPGKMSARMRDAFTRVHVQRKDSLLIG